ncbi:hypothetical protein [Kribbella italica]|uniref:Scaffolding protein n=1 Tax=Kribbella italica TaxID=1540520 RepID=A0A7W9MS05_9ACTN|nr:hypothetical protein [Kribbella italica]MBB5833418.1 hypothetical protein [Kribbella italica]
MSDTTVSTETTETPEVPAGTTPPETPDGTTPPEGAAPEGEQPDPLKELPEWAQKELTKVRGEAANYRTKLRDAEAKLGQAKTPEEYEAAVNELKTANADLERQVLVNTVATKHKLPDELAAVLQGQTAEELEAHAEKLAKFAPAEEVEPENLSGGLKPGTSDTGAFDPVAASRAARKRRR